MESSNQADKQAEKEKDEALYKALQETFPKQFSTLAECPHTISGDHIWPDGNYSDSKTIIVKHPMLSGTLYIQACGACGLYDDREYRKLLEESKKAPKTYEPIF